MQQMMNSKHHKKIEKLIQLTVADCASHRCLNSSLAFSRNSLTKKGEATIEEKYVCEDKFRPEIHPKSMRKRRRKR
ncbi:hypothetical protein T4B_477 [Trichinella pseudospiralis]|uniref:Uncharacterized protein n=1 Tax=Trichinella pseudospiralis TaxID=6337 RepID=A0A0V1IAX2_TRIPS|nr:hypothetical protein T4B_477 [Trichinella pseudospiralis]